MVDRARSRSRRARRARAVFLALLLTLGSLAVPFPDSRRMTLRKLQPVVSIRASQGYWLVAADGGVFAFGDARFLGPNRNQGLDIIGMARTPDGNGLWTVDDDGDVFHTGSAINYGSRLVDTNDIRGFAARPQGDGYWMATKNGAVYAFGKAAFQGPFVPLNLNKLIVGMAATASGGGYWMVARDGGIFTYGDAAFYGSTGAIALNQPIVGMSPTPSGNGYWLVASDGGIFSFGDAKFFGSTGSIRLNQPIVGMAPTGTGNGYWLVAQDGGIFSFGDAKFFGSTGGLALNQPIVGMVPTRVIRSNDFPNAGPDSVTLDEDTPVTLNVLANDSGLTDAPITVSLVEGPGHGLATVGADGRVTYSPAANYFGPDALTYAVVDADGDQSITTLSIAVTSRNDVPVAPDQALFTPEETPATGSVAATDADGDPITYSVTAAPAHGTASVDGAGFFTYMPAADYNGNDSFTITVSDGRGGTDTAKIGVSVGSLNDPPVATDAAVTTAEDTPVTGTVVATDPEGDSFTYSVSTLPAHGTASVDAAGGYTYTPALDYVGADSFVITVDDGHGATDTATISVTVTNTNDPPVANDQTLSTNEDTLLTGGVGATDPDLDTLSYSVTGAAAHGTATVNSAGGFGYTPALNYSGPDSFVITVSDGQGGSDTATISVTVVPVNDPPVANDQSLSTNQDVDLNGSVGASDAENNPLTSTVTQQAAHGTAEITDSSTGAFTYTPAAGFVGADWFIVTVSDGQGGFDTATISVTVTNTNDAPVANDASIEITEDAPPFSGAVGASDADGDPLSYSVTAGPAHGTASVNSSGNFTYDSALNYNGVDSFTITVSDGQGGSDTATISVTVNPVNDAPVAVADVRTSDGTAITFNVTANDSDPDGALVIGDIDFNNTTVFGSLSCSSTSGECTYTPNAGLLPGAYEDTFTYTLIDSSGAASGLALVTITTTISL